MIFVKGLPPFVEMNAVRSAQKNRRAQKALKPFDAPGYIGRGYAEILCGQGKILGFGGIAKVFKL